MPRHQFSLRSLFVVTTLAAIASAVGPLIYRVLESLDPLASLIIVVFLPLGGGAALLLAVLPFAYRRAVSEINDAKLHDVDDSPATRLGG